MATRRLLEEQLVVVAVLGSGKKSDDMWHVPHYYYDYNHNINYNHNEYL